MLLQDPPGDPLLGFVASVDFAWDVFRHLVSDAHDAMTVVDRDARVAWISPVHERFFGLGPGAAAGRPVREVIENTQLPRVLRTGRAEAGEIQRVRGQDRVVSRVPIRRDGRVVGAIGRVMFRGPEQVEALARRGSVTIGRLQARLQPPGTAGGWTERLAAAPLSGGLRYNGPADLLPALAGLTDHQLAGPIGIAADFGGRLAEPQLAGLVRASGLTYLNTVYGTRLTDLSLAGQFTNDRLEINRLTGKAGDGAVTAQGRIGLASAAGYPVDLTVDLDRARMARSDALGATATGRLRLTGPFTEGVLIAGELRLPEARYQVVRQGAAEIAVLEGVRRKGDPLPEPGAAAAERRRAAAAGLFRFDLRLRAPDQLFVSGMGLESEWGADLRIGGTSTAPAMTGTVNLVRGTYSFAGRRFDLDRASTLSFQGGTNPLIDIRANAEIDGLTVALVVTGRAQSPQIALTSTPSLPQDELLARVLFGESITNLSALQAVQLAAALNNLRGTGGGLNPLGKLRSAAGIDRLRILGEDERTGRGAALAAGAYVSNDIYVEIITDARGFTATQIEVALSRALSILSQTSSFSGTSVELRYRRNY